MGVSLFRMEQRSQPRHRLGVAGVTQGPEGPFADQVGGCATAIQAQSNRSFSTGQALGGELTDEAPPQIRRDGGPGRLTGKSPQIGASERMDQMTERHVEVGPENEFVERRTVGPEEATRVPISLQDHVQHDPVVGGVALMAVAIPRSGEDVKLDGPGEQHAVDSEPGVLEVWTGAPVEASGRDDPNGPTQYG